MSIAWLDRVRPMWGVPLSGYGGSEGDAVDPGRRIANVDGWCGCWVTTRMKSNGFVYVCVVAVADVCTGFGILKVYGWCGF